MNDRIVEKGPKVGIKVSGLNSFRRAHREVKLPLTVLQWPRDSPPLCIKHIDTISNVRNFGGLLFDVVWMWLSLDAKPNAFGRKSEGLRVDNVALLGSVRRANL